MIRLENVLKISLQNTWICLKEVLKISWRHFWKTSWRRPQNLLKTPWQDILKTSSEDVRLRRAYLSWSRRLEDVFSRRKAKAKHTHLDQNVLKASWRHLLQRKTKEVFKMSSPWRIFAGKCLKHFLTVLFQVWINLLFTPTTCLNHFSPMFHFYTP